MFRPLAWTKTLAVGFSSLLAITLVPVLMVLLVRDRLRPEAANPVSSLTQALYLPVAAGGSLAAKQARAPGAAAPLAGGGVIDIKTEIQEDASMRTTLDLPDELLKRAKIAAVERGVTLRELIGSAVAKELAAGVAPELARPRVRFPLFSSARPGSMELTNADLARAEDEEDLRRLGLSR